MKHKSDCALHNAPAYKPGSCDCDVEIKIYQINTQCSNCGRVQLEPIYVPKGQTWYHYIKETKLKCEHCKCTDCLNRVSTNLGEKL